MVRNSRYGRSLIIFLASTTFIPDGYGDVPFVSDIRNNAYFDELQVQKRLATRTIDNRDFQDWEDLEFSAVVTSIFALQAFVLNVTGQPIISTSGCIALWNGDIYGPENSQQLLDWYSFTHVLHGFLLYYTSGFIPFINTSVRSRFVFAFGLEAAWEMVENSKLVINRYRQTATAQGYSGDTVINSLTDTLAMSFGFILATKLKPLTVLWIAIAEEIILGAIIRDNLFLNVIQLLHPSETISTWQAGMHKRIGEFKNRSIQK